MTEPNPITVKADALRQLVAALFTRLGVSERAASIVADGLVEADCLGVVSHGVMLVDLYIDRIRAGSVSLREEADIVSDRNATLVLDAGNGLGQPIAEQAMTAAVARAGAHGAGIVAVRNAFHFGMARRYALMAARQGAIGIAMCNTRPLMPPPGGAEPLVGNNPIAIAVPTATEPTLVLDMAMSEAAMGKIRMAAKAGQPIPASWAVKTDGSPTTDPEEAIAGMLLPAAGPKGFGLAVMVDLMAGLLAGGGVGGGVKPLYGDMTVPYNCSQLFVAIDAGHFGSPDTFATLAGDYAEHIRAARKAPGVAQLYAPGEPEWRRGVANDDTVVLQPAVAAMLRRFADELNVTADALQPNAL